MAQLPNFYFLKSNKVPFLFEKYNKIGKKKVLALQKGIMMTMMTIVMRMIIKMLMIMMLILRALMLIVAHQAFGLKSQTQGLRLARNSSLV